MNRPPRPTAIDLTTAYVQANYENILYQYSEDGGWEVWFQNELVKFIRSHGTGIQRYAEREEPIWSGGHEADKVDIRTNYRLNQKNCIEIIELKCASTKQDLHAGNLAKRMLEDVRKLQNGQEYIKKFIGADQDIFYGVAIGITLDDSSTAATEVALTNALGYDLVSRFDYGPSDHSSKTITVWSYWLYQTR